MPLFSEDDFNKISKSQLDMPDGLIDGNHYYQTFETFLGHLENLDPKDYESKIVFMMNIVNPASNEDNSINHEYVYDLITCMSFHIVELFSVAENYLNDFKNEYLKIIRQEVLEKVKQECEGLPYWE
jgi:hypothetical protein